MPCRPDSGRKFQCVRLGWSWGNRTRARCASSRASKNPMAAKVSTVASNAPPSLGRWTAGRSWSWSCGCTATSSEPSFCPCPPQVVSSLTAASAVLREAQLKAPVRRVQPARGDHLAAGEELHALRAVGVRGAEQAVLPPAERVVRHRHWDRHVDADHADLHLVLEAPSGAAVVREDRCAVAVLVAVDEVERLVVGVDAEHGQDRAEDLVG